MGEAPEREKDNKVKADAENEKETEEEQVHQPKVAEVKSRGRRRQDGVTSGTGSAPALKEEAKPAASQAEETKMLLTAAPGAGSSSSNVKAPSVSLKPEGKPWKKVRRIDDEEVGATVPESVRRSPKDCSQSTSY